MVELKPSHLGLERGRYEEIFRTVTNRLCDWRGGLFQKGEVRMSFYKFDLWLVRIALVVIILHFTHVF